MKLIIIIAFLLCNSLNLECEGYELWNWGFNGFGEIGIGSSESRIYVPQKIGKSNEWKFCVKEGNKSFAIKTDGSLWACGDNSNGSLGDGTDVDKYKFIQIGYEYNWKFITSGITTFAIKDNGTLWGWGSNDYGQIGDGTKTPRRSPVKIGNDNDWAFVSNGHKFTVAIKNDGSLWGWGVNSYGRMGDSIVNNSLVPKKISERNDWKTCCAGYGFMAAITNDGSMFVGGDNYFGQIGDGSGIKNSFPTKLGESNEWKSVSCWVTNFAIKKDGSLWAWGENSNGQTGCAYTAKNIYYPTRVGMDNDWAKVIDFGNQTYALKTNGSLWKWGHNDIGVGDSLYKYILEPIQFGNETDWVQFSMSMGLRRNITSIEELVNIDDFNVQVEENAERILIKYLESEAVLEVSFYNNIGSKIDLPNVSYLTNQISIPTENLQNGVYFITLIQESKTKAIPILINK